MCFICSHKRVGIRKDYGTFLEQGVRREPQSSFLNTNTSFAKGPGMWTPLYRTGGTYPQNCVMETPRFSFSELHLGQFPDSVDFQCWKVNFKTDVCANTPCPTLTMSWIKEVEMSTSMDDFMTSQWIEGKVIPDFEMLDAKMRLH